MNRYLMNSRVLITLLAMSCLCAGVSASGMEFTLYIFGNANGDMNIDQQDIALIEQIATGKADPTTLADANQDGKVDSKDVDQVKAIMDGSATVIIVQDAYGNPVTVKTPVERIVTLDQMIAENAQVIGVGDKIVGIDENTASRTTTLPEISTVTNIGSSDEPDLEAIVALKPGLVCGIQWFDEELMSKMKAAGLTPLAMIYHGDIQNSLGYSKMLGYLTGSPDSAMKYIDWMSGNLGGIHDTLSGLSDSERARAMYLYPRKGALGSGGSECPTIRTLEFLGANTLTDRAANTENGYFEIDPEEIIKKNPDYIVMEDFDTALGYGKTDKAAAQEELDKVKAKTGFDKINAVKNDDVYLLDVNIVSHSNCLGGIYMAKAIYPEKLADVDPYAIHQEYVDRFLGLKDFDVKTDGIFIYPEVA